MSVAALFVSSLSTSSISKRLPPRARIIERTF
jgi:hypothetical protein